MDIQCSTNVSGCGQRVPKVLARPRQNRGTRNNNEVRVQRLENTQPRDDRTATENTQPRDDRTATGLRTKPSAEQLQPGA